MWDQKQRATAVVFYSLAVVAGPNLGVSGRSICPPKGHSH
jgi:hypothetical protein